MGHYCRICGRVRANERFSGKGHKNHICKECSKLPVKERNETTALNQIYGLYRYNNLSKANRRMLEGYLKHTSDNVRVAADEVLKEFARPKYNDISGLDLYEYNDEIQDEGAHEDHDSWIVELDEEDNDLSGEDDLPF